MTLSGKRSYVNVIPPFMADEMNRKEKRLADKEARAKAKETTRETKRRRVA